MTPERQAALLAELVAQHGNAFGCGSCLGEHGGPAGVRILMTDPIVDRCLSRAEVANLVAWLVIVGDLERWDLEHVFRAQGVAWPLDR